MSITDIAVVKDFVGSELYIYRVGKSIGHEGLRSNQPLRESCGASRSPGWPSILCHRDSAAFFCFFGSSFSFGSFRVVSFGVVILTFLTYRRVLFIAGSPTSIKFSGRSSILKFFRFVVSGSDSVSGRLISGVSASDRVVGAGEGEVLRGSLRFVRSLLFSFWGIGVDARRGSLCLIF